MAVKVSKTKVRGRDYPSAPGGDDIYPTVPGPKDDRWPDPN
jgi:hypothetical protein